MFRLLRMSISELLDDAADCMHSPGKTMLVMFLLVYVETATESCFQIGVICIFEISVQC